MVQERDIHSGSSLPELSSELNICGAWRWGGCVSHYLQRIRAWLNHIYNKGLYRDQRYNQWPAGNMKALPAAILSKNLQASDIPSGFKDWSQVIEFAATLSRSRKTWITWYPPELLVLVLHRPLRKYVPPF